MNKLSNVESGQALLLVLLSMAVVLTIVLSILSRSVTDIGVTSRGEDSVRAFSAAEAGIEQALVAGVGTGQVTIGGNATFNASVSPFPALSSATFNSPSDLFSGDSLTVWFVSHNENGNLTCAGGNPCFTGKDVKFCWGKEGTSAGSSTTPALEVTVFYDSTPGDASTAKIARVTSDPYSGRTPTNLFSGTDGATCQVNGQNYAFSKSVDLSLLGIPAGVYTSPGGLQFARLRILYNTDITQPIAVSVGSSSLPSQGVQIDSLGAAGTSNRKVQVFQGYAETPVIFTSAAFGLGGISQ